MRPFGWVFGIIRSRAFRFQAVFMAILYRAKNHITLSKSDANLTHEPILSQRPALFGIYYQCEIYKKNSFPATLYSVNSPLRGLLNSR